MYIEGRKKKKYSEKLFNELCFLSIFLYSEGDIPFYILDRKIKVSERTYFRYIEELRKCGALPYIKKGKAAKTVGGNEKNDHFILDLNSYEEYGSSYSYGSMGPISSYIDFDCFMRSLDDEHPVAYDPKNRLQRCAKMLTRNYQKLYPLWDVYDDDDMPSNLEIVDIDGKEYVFYEFDTCDRLYETLSVRSKQRDVRIVKDALIYMFEP